MQAFLKERRPIRQNNNKCFLIIWIQKKIVVQFYIHEIVIKLNLVYLTKLN